MVFLPKVPSPVSHPLIGSDWTMGPSLNQSQLRRWAWLMGLIQSQSLRWTGSSLHLTQTLTAKNEWVGGSVAKESQREETDSGKSEHISTFCWNLINYKTLLLWINKHVCDFFLGLSWLLYKYKKIYSKMSWRRPQALALENLKNRFTEQVPRKWGTAGYPHRVQAFGVRKY